MYNMYLDSRFFCRHISSKALDKDLLLRFLWAEIYFQPSLIVDVDVNTVVFRSLFFVFFLR